MAVLVHGRRRERVCGRCGGTGEVWPDDPRLTAAQAEARARPCPECGGSGSPGAPPPPHLDGDRLVKIRREDRAGPEDP